MSIDRRALSLLLVTLIPACAPASGGSARREMERARVDSLIAQVRVGDSRRDVERVLGRPYRVEPDGRETVMTYVTGPEVSAQEAFEAQRAQANLQSLSGILSSLGSYGGSGLSSAGSIGSQVASAGSSLNRGGYAQPSQERSEVEVRLRAGKVVSVERIDSGRIGIGAQ